MRPVERVLLIRLTALGDVVLLTPAIRALRAAHPGVCIDLVTDARYVEFARAHLGVDHVVGYDRHGEHAGYRGVAKVQATLPHDHYDAVVDLQGKLRTRSLARRVSADRHLVMQKRTLKQGALAVFGYDPPIADRRAAELYLQALMPLGIPPDASLETHLVGSEPRQHHDSPRIGLSVGASHATKRWPAAHFAELCTALHDAHPQARFVLIGGPCDQASLDAVRDALPEAWVDPQEVSALPVLGLAGLIAALDLMISVDTGPAHLAAAFSVPTVVLFGPTAPARWGPVGPAHAAVSLNLSCAPCSNTGGAQCPDSTQSHACMLKLGVQDVLPAALAALERCEG